MLFTERQIAESRRTRHDRRVATFPVSSALVGRAGDLTALENAFADEQVTTVLIGGEAGIGKSRLAGEFISRLGEDVLVLVGRCPEFGADGVPFAPFIAVMRSLERQRDTEEIATLLPPNPALARWMPRLAARTGPAAADSDQIRLSGEILTLLEQLALTQPVLLVLEDLHWADDSSRELFAFLVANLAQDQVLLIGTDRRTSPQCRYSGGFAAAADPARGRPTAGGAARPRTRARPDHSHRRPQRRKPSVCRST
jgi:predicted ATPase